MGGAGLTGLDVEERRRGKHMHLKHSYLSDVVVILYI